MTWVDGGVVALVEAAVKAAVMVVVAVLGLRVGERRTLAQLTTIDVVAAVAVGAVVGRTALAADQPLLTGVVVLVTILLAHRGLSVLRMRRPVARLLRHPVRVLVRDGVVLEPELRRSRLTREDLHSQLRTRGVLNVAELRWVLYEPEGRLTVVRRDAPTGEPLVAEVVDADPGPGTDG
ncbi:hypothetical protein GCM10027047_10460 [Rhodococcus aerolatus]